MNCKNCGATITGDTLFCDKCGMPQEKLIKLVLSGDQHAFELLYNYSYQSVYWTIHSMANLDEDTIYDIMQNSYLKAYRALPQLNEPTAFNGWIKKIAQNETLDYLRKSGKDNAIFFSDMVSDDSDVEEYDIKDETVETNPEASMEYKDRSRLLNEILDAIPEEQRVVLSMYYMQQMSIKEIADELGISENTVKSRMSYGRKKVEKSVLDLEKKGVSLLGLTAMGFFTWLLTGITSDAAEAIPETVLQGAEQGLSDISSSSASMAEDITGAQNIEEAGSMAEMAAKEAGKEAARTAGKAGTAKIVAGVIGVAVVGTIIGSVVYNVNSRNGNSEQAELVYETEAQTLNTEMIIEELESESEPETESLIEEKVETESELELAAEPETETVSEPETESETEHVTETESETELETETETETESESESIVSLSDDDVILDTIHALGYDYIGGQSYDVIYQGGYAYSDNAGMEQDPPVGVASYALADLDGDGEEELLLVILEPTERLYDSSGKQDSRLAFTVCENQDGAWVESQSISQASDFHDGTQINIASIADLLPCISTYLVPSGNGMHIVIDSPFYGSFPADNFFETIEIVYTGDGMTGVVYGAWTDYVDGENEAISALEEGMRSAGSELISKIYVSGFYNDANEFNWSVFTPLQMGQDISATLVVEDFKDLRETGSSGNEENPAESEIIQEETEQNGVKRVEKDGLLIVYEDSDEEEEETEAPLSEISEEAQAAYQVILDEYIAASNDNVGDEEMFAQDYIEQQYPDVASRIMFYYSPGAGTVFYYTYYDIDGNGQDELLIGSGYDAGGDSSSWLEYIDVVDVYTFDGEKAVKFTENANTLGDRSQLYIFENGAIVIHDSGGAAYGDYRFMKINDDGYTVRLDKEYIYSSENGEPFTYSSDDETLTEEEFMEFFSEYIGEPIDSLMTDDGYFQYETLAVTNYNWIEFIE